MCVWLYATRIPALKKHNIVYDPHRPSEEFHFYAVALTLAFLGAGSGVNAGLAWLYVALRIAHSLVQALMNKVMIRLALFAAASIVLLVMAVRAAWTML